MSVIWKYPVPYEAAFEHEMPAGAEVLAVQTQHQGNPRLEQMVMWARVDQDAPRETRRFQLAGTGNEPWRKLGRYLGTCQLNGGSLVFHVFEASA